VIRTRLQIAFGLVVTVWFLSSGIYLLDKGRMRGVARGSLEHKSQAPTNELFAKMTDHRPRPEDTPVEFTGGSGLDDDNPLVTDNPLVDDNPLTRGNPLAGSTGAGSSVTASPGGEGFAYSLGTDSLGRGLARLVLAAPGFYLFHGTLYVGLALTAMIVLGVAGGYVRRGPVGFAARWLVEANHALPQLLVIFVVLAITRASMTWFVLVLALISGTAKSILIRNKIESVRAMDFMEGLREMGIPTRTVIWRHLLRSHCKALIIVQVPFLLAELVLFEAALGYLGQPVDVNSQISFGALLANAVNYPVAGAYWPFAVPALGIIFLIWGFSALGTGLVHVFNERNPYSL